MEDQPADTGDLTTEASDSLVPQGKSGRRRHRLPRQALRQSADERTASPDATDVPEPADTDDATATVDAVSTPEAADVEPTAVEPEPAVELEQSAEVESPAEEPEPEPVPEVRGRRRWWSRKEVPAAATPVSEDDEATSESDSTPTEPAELAVDAVDTPASDVAEAEVAEPEVAETDGAEAVEDGEPHDADDSSDEPEPILVPHRTAGRGLKVAAIVAGVLLVGASAFAGATLQPYLADRAAVHTKFAIAEAAAGAIRTLFTYTPEDMESLPNRAAGYLNPSFAKDYRDYIDSIVPGNKQAQITSNTEVVGAAVESLSGNEATAIVYTNSVATSPLTKGIPSLRYQSHKVSLERTGRQWLITQMAGITSVDLTPRL